MNLVKVTPILAVALSSVSTAFAETSAITSGATSAETQEALDEASLIPAAEDTLGGHFTVGAAGILAIPFAKLDTERAFHDKANTGFGAGLDLGFGVSRSVVLGITAQYLAFQADESCARCDPESLGVGAFVRYHLVQGVRFDPWTSLGAGYRFLNTGENKYSGIDWLRFAIGGDWYALSQVAFGPYLELDLGTFLRTPARSNPSVYATASLGIRVALDFPGK